MGAPSAKGGKAIYDTGKKDSIGKTWQENTSKGNKAKIYDGNKTWIGEWIGGPQPEYFFGRREDKERTQWFAGGGDGILVWDHNGNGIIDDGTELMSEYDIQGNKVFANGLVKLGHYFDKDGNGVVEAKEMKGLMFWIDDGDGKTEQGELQPLSKFGITEIRIPADDKTLKTEYKQAKKDQLTLSGGQYQEALPEVQDYPTDQIVPPILDNTPGREFVLGGEVQLESKTEYDIWLRVIRNKSISTFTKSISTSTMPKRRK